MLQYCSRALAAVVLLELCTDTTTCHKSLCSLSAGFYKRLECVQSTRPWRSYHLRTAQDGLVGSVPGENGFLSHCAHNRQTITILKCPPRRTLLPDPTVKT